MQEDPANRPIDRAVGRRATTVGLDTSMSVDENDHQLRFCFAGKLVKLTLNAIQDRVKQGERLGMTCPVNF